METQKANPAQNLMNSLNIIFEELSKKTGEIFPKINWCYEWFNAKEIHAHIDYDLWEDLNFEKCSKHFLSRLFCNLAHGDDSCGSKKFVSIKRANQKADSEIVSVLYNWGLRKYIKDGFIWHKFEIDRTHIRRIAQIEFNFPITIFSNNFQSVYNKYQSEKTDINWASVRKVLEKEFFNCNHKKNIIDKDLVFKVLQKEFN